MLKGKAKPSYIYELIIPEEDAHLPYDVVCYTQHFAKGFTAYQQADWDQAIQYFKECLHIYPTDALAPIFISRCQQLKLSPPKDWQGIWIIGNPRS
jgi:adenylate cyclase